MKTHSNPFLDSPPKEIPLTDSPLVRVIAQVQFPAQLSLGERPTISRLQKVIGEAFPVLEEQRLNAFIFELGSGEGGRLQSQTTPEPQWRFSNPGSGFVLQINTGSITFETTKYTSRVDFFARFHECLRQIHLIVPIQFMTRLGVRYVDQVPQSRCPTVASMLCPELGGISGLGFGLPVDVDLHEFRVPVLNEDGVLFARTGFLPSGGTIDPVVLPPLQESSWILDIDVFRQSAPGEVFQFDPEALAQQGSAFSLRIYTVFRWIVKNEFLETFGGEP